jgi:hypothetical protein
VLLPRTLIAAAVTVSAATPSASVREAVLRPAQVGEGFVAKPIRGGGKVQGQVTIDLCGFRFASEQRRRARLQLAYIRRDSNLAVSNEVVSYRAGGTALALREVDRAVRTCPPREVPSRVSGVPPLRYTFARLSTSGTGLLAGAIALRITVTGTVNGKRLSETSFGIYQRYRNLLSGIYVYGGSVSERRVLAFKAAAASARNLKRAAKGP